MTSPQPKFVIVHRRDAENAKRMNIFLSAEGAERKITLLLKLMWY
jgi:hypothetical protein